MASITGWTRIEPRVRDPKMRAGLAARIRDPLWMLSRQWQTGEFLGHDGGSAVAATVEFESSILSRFCVGNEGSKSLPEPEGYDPTAVPLEVMIERERMRRLPGTVAVAAEAGLHFLRLLVHYDIHNHRQIVPQSYTLHAPDDALRMSQDPETNRLWQIMAGRVPDGSLLYRDLNSAFPLPDRTGTVPDGWSEDEPRLTEAIVAWLDWYDQLYSEPGGDAACWVDQRLEYRAAVGAAGNGAEHVLWTGEYDGKQLDWYSFDYLRGATLGAEAASGVISRMTVVPTRVASRGMPAERWWQFEDASLDFGAVDVAVEDLIRLPWIRFALLHAGDWSIFPLDVPVGSLTWIHTLTVRDSFGSETAIDPVHTSDDGAACLFRLSSKDPDGPLSHADKSVFDALFLPPTLPARLHGKPVEQVDFVRDDMANLAWAVERVVQSGAGEALNRQEEYDRRPHNPQPASVAAHEGAEISYRLCSSLPDHWIPLVPTDEDGGSGGPRLVPGRLHRRETREDPAVAGPRGHILQPDTPLRLYRDEIPRNGVAIARLCHYARWLDGSRHLWIGRRRQLGRAHGSSGLSFDIVE